MSTAQVYALFISPLLVGAVGLAIFYVTGLQDRRAGKS